VGWEPEGKKKVRGELEPDLDSRYGETEASACHSQ